MTRRMLSGVWMSNSGSKPPCRSVSPSTEPRSIGRALSTLGAGPIAARTSSARTRPSGPDPVMLPRSMPAWRAMRSARVDVPGSSPLGWGAFCTCCNPCDSCRSGLARESGVESSPPASFASKLAPTAGGVSEWGVSECVVSAAVSSSTASTWSACTSSLPSATRISVMTPASSASSSTTALSLSISAMTSPGDTLAPTPTCHLMSVTAASSGDTRGRRMSVVMTPGRRRHRRPG